MMQQYKCRNPVLLRIFRRPRETAQVMRVLGEVKPDKLYIAGDGPRGLSETEDNNVFSARQVASNPAWDCELITLFMPNNLGGPKCGFESISWFFSHEEKGIILEDDNLPSIDFFKFCDELLSRYEKEPRVFAITGNNFQNGQARGNATYYFSRYPHIWGWATWRRAWRHATLDIDFWPEWKRSEDWRLASGDRVFRKYWSKIFDFVASGERVHWDYAWTATCWFHKGVVATPNVNLVSNIGFGPDGSNTLDSRSPLSKIPTENIGTIRHPENISINTEADRYVFAHTFGGRWRRFPYSLVRLPRRVAGFAYRRMQQFFV